MNRYLLFVLLWLLASLSASAQSATVRGTVIGDGNEPLVRASVQLFKADSTFAGGALTDAGGKFSVRVTPGKYKVRISYLGYLPVSRNLGTVGVRGYDMGRIVMKADAVVLDEAVITGTVPKVVMVEDTFVYNSAAYKTPEGSTLDALVERLPGAKVDDNGNITLNGKEVTKILVDGREFMPGNMKEALESLPVSIVDKIKAYDEKSEMAKLTGIDDGEERTVIDFGVKKEMKKGMHANADLGYGTDDRYASRLNLSRFYGDLRYTLMGRANNIQNRSIRSAGRRGGNGLSSRKSAGLNVNYEKRNRLKVDWNINWNHNDNDSQTKSSSENFVNTTGAFSNSVSSGLTRSDSWNTAMRLEWKPDTLQTITFRPQASFSANDGMNSGASASFNADPYLYASDPLSLDALSQMAADSVAVNSRRNKSLRYSSNKSLSAYLQYHRRLSAKGRNIGLSAEFNLRDNSSRNISTTNVVLYQVRDQAGNDSTYQTNRYNVAPSKSGGYSVQATYTEPLFRAVFLQFSYRYRFSFSESDRSTFDFGRMDYTDYSAILNDYRDWDSYLSTLDRPLDYYLDDDLSRYSKYENHTHDISLQLRMVRAKYNLNLGVLVQPQRSHFIQDYRGINVDTVRTTTNITPTLNFRYRFSRRTTLRATYRGRTNQPSITQMLDITDDSNPLNITKGNPGLSPSFTSTMRVEFNSYSQRRQRNISTSVDFSTTANSISNIVTYDEATGGRTTQPQNINGNWDMAARFMLNSALDTVGVWRVGTNTQFRYDNYVSYITLDRQSDSQKNITRTANLGQDLSLSYNKDWLEIELDGTLDYTHTRNMLRKNANLDTWRFAYGANVTVDMTWNMSLTTSIHQTSRRGYSDNTMNTDELIWNMQLSQSFLRKKALTVSLQWYDILARQSNVTRRINANRRNDSEYNGINSYAMLHVIYKMNMFGGRKGRGKGRSRM